MYLRSSPVAFGPFIRHFFLFSSLFSHRIQLQDKDFTQPYNITPATGKERGDVEIREYIVLQKTRDLTDCLPPPRTLILDFTLTHTRFGKSQMSSLGQLTHTRRTDGAKLF
jgi:hypothetical protein